MDVATRTATQPRNAVIYRINLPCSMIKGFKSFLERDLALGRAKNTDCMAKKQRCVVVAVRVAVVLQLCCNESPRNTGRVVLSH